LRSWRQHRRLSQLDLALNADVSARHISFLETGRSLPSREMLLRIAEQLELPLRDRNTLLVAAGYAPVYSRTPLDHPTMRAAREAVELVLAGHEPYPALAIDRHWTLVTANRSIAIFLTGVAADLLEPPINVMRLSLHPGGLAPRIINLGEWRSHALARLLRQIEVTADPVLAALHDELSGYPLSDNAGEIYEGETGPQHGGLVVPVRLQTDRGVLSFISTTTVFGTAVDITLDELAIESFFPADQATAEVLRQNH
jgi:transcriptional regulator with XRE-family HTH domain